MTVSQHAGKHPRIIIGLRAGMDIDLPVGAATSLAAAIKAEVFGLFVQEQAMFDLAGLPFARVSKFGTAKTTALTTKSLATAMNQSAEVCRRTLSTYADKAQIRWSFSTQRGELPIALMGHVAAGDFLVLSRMSRGFGSAQLIGELRSAPSNVSGIVVAAAKDSARRDAPVVAIDDGDAAGEVTLLLAQHVAKDRDAPICLFAVAATDARTDLIVERAGKLIEPAQRLIIKRLSPGLPETLASELIRIAPSFVVADLEGEPFHNDDSILMLLRAAGAPVILIRSHTGIDDG